MKNTPRPCATPDCNKPVEPGNSWCRRCRARRQRESSPVRVAWRQLRANAKRRGKVFALSFAFFSRVAIETDYVSRRGRSATSYHIDRIDADGGYTEDNVQVLPAYLNVRKDNPGAAPKLSQSRQGAWCPETQQMVFWTSFSYPELEAELGITHPEYVPPPPVLINGVWWGKPTPRLADCPF